METRKIADTLVSLQRDGRYLDAISAFYSDDVVSVEPRAEVQGIDFVRAKACRWIEDHDIHAVAAEGPVVDGDRFSVVYDYDMTPRTGQQAGTRTHVRETAVYTTRRGRIVREELFRSSNGS
jgi:ketosteroid isomerase-like protein